VKRPSISDSSDPDDRHICDNAAADYRDYESHLRDAIRQATEALAFWHEHGEPIPGLLVDAQRSIGAAIVKGAYITARAPFVSEEDHARFKMFGAKRNGRKVGEVVK
jgi:hypothetical protein